MISSKRSSLIKLYFAFFILCCFILQYHPVCASDRFIDNKDGTVNDTKTGLMWASDTRGYTAGRFNFTYGKDFWLRKSYSGPTRVLPVRTKK